MCMKWIIIHRLWSCNQPQSTYLCIHWVKWNYSCSYYLNTKLSTYLSTHRNGARVCIQFPFKPFKVIKTVKMLHKRVVQDFVYVTAVTQYQCHFISRGKEWVISYCTNRHTRKSNISSTRTEYVLPIKHKHRKIETYSYHHPTRPQHLSMLYNAKSCLSAVTILTRSEKSIQNKSH